MIEHSLNATEKKLKDVFTKIENHNLQLHACPLCGSEAELWERCEESTLTGEMVAHKAVMCANGEPIGPLDVCPLYMPPEPFYLSRRVEAAYFWNAFAVAASNLAKKNQRSRITKPTHDKEGL
jgi:hypothetical protein